MNVPINAVGFIKQLDAAIWVKDRIFSSRLIVLDRINNGKSAQDFIGAIARWLPQDVNSISLPDYKDNWFELLAGESAQAFIGGTARPGTRLEIFFHHLNIYGLRECLAYLYEFQDPKVTEPIHNFIYENYPVIARDYVEKKQQIKRYFKEAWDSATGKSGGKWRGPYEPPHRRMIVAWGAVSGGDPWHEGLAQIRGQ
jgi:hypothetical protein